jgi:hypothetical protein
LFWYVSSDQVLHEPEEKKRQKYFARRYSIEGNIFFYHSMIFARMNCANISANLKESMEDNLPNYFNYGPRRGLPNFSLNIIFPQYQ